MNAPLRQFASPYARRLARERGIVLADLAGSGPAGRVVAADILAFIKPLNVAEPAASPEQGSSPAPPAAFIAALATEIDLGKLLDLIEQFAGARLALSADALLLRAAARSLAAVDIEGAVGWEAGKGAETLIADAGSLSLGALQARLDSAGATSSGGSPTAALSIRRLKSSGIRAVFMPPQPGHRMRLVLCGDGGASLDCLLAFDTGSIDEEQAVDFLARFKDDLEAPLRLLA